MGLTNRARLKVETRQTRRYLGEKIYVLRKLANGKMVGSFSQLQLASQLRCWRMFEGMGEPFASTQID